MMAFVCFKQFGFSIIASRKEPRQNSHWWSKGTWRCLKTKSFGSDYPLSAEYYR
jgi:hypothetical protein